MEQFNKTKQKPLALTPWRDYFTDVSVTCVGRSSPFSKILQISTWMFSRTERKQEYFNADDIQKFHCWASLSLMLMAKLKIKLASPNLVARKRNLGNEVAFHPLFVVFLQYSLLPRTSSWRGPGNEVVYSLVWYRCLLECWCCASGKCFGDTLYFVLEHIASCHVLCLRRITWLWSFLKSELKPCKLIAGNCGHTVFFLLFD